MAIHKLDFEEIEVASFQLIAIHTALEDYRLAYFINKKLQINLAIHKNDLTVQSKEGETKLTRYYYDDEEKSISWNLIQNKNFSIEIKTNPKNSLFDQAELRVQTRVHLLQDYKKVDFFLKIEGTPEQINTNIPLKLLKKIKSIAMVYTVDTNQIKAKNNLIF